KGQFAHRTLRDAVWHPERWFGVWARELAGFVGCCGELASGALFAILCLALAGCIHISKWAARAFHWSLSAITHRMIDASIVSCLDNESLLSHVNTQALHRRQLENEPPFGRRTGLGQRCRRQSRQPRRPGHRLSC